MSNRIGVPVFLPTDVVFDDAHPRPRGRDHRPVPGVPLRAAAAAASGAVGGGLRLAARHRVLRPQARISPTPRCPRSRRSTPCTSAAPAASTWSASAPTRCARGSAATPSTRRCPQHLGVGHEETAGEPGTPGSITLEHAECLAACDHGPVLQVNYEFFDNQTPDAALDLVTDLQAGRRPSPTRGAPLTDFKSVELEIAGIFTDLAGAGGGADRVGAHAARVGAGRAHRAARADHARARRDPAAAGEEVTPAMRSGVQPDRVSDEYQD